MTLEDELSDITADLVSLKENALFLERLFSTDSGSWQDLISLCLDLTSIEKRLSSSKDIIDAVVKVTWIDYPVSFHGEGYCILIFFSEPEKWDNIALFNKGHFEKRTYRAHMTDTF